MVGSRQWLGMTIVLALSSCDTVTEPREPAPLDSEMTEHKFFHPGRLIASTRGHGSYQIIGLDADFAHTAIRLPHGRSVGLFRHRLVLEGQLIDFIGKVTCVTFDPEEGRAWIGGVVIRNKSEHPGFTTEIHQPGRDIWFRVLDTGRHSEEPDRTTFVGFEGGAGIITSQEYCDVQPWPDDNARTNALTSGRIVNRD